MEPDGKWGIYLIEFEASETAFDEAIRGDKVCISYLQ